MSFQAFISYKSEERPHALKLRDTLRAWGYGTWFDQDNIRKGEYFRDEIQKGLETSAVVVGVLTNASVKSREVLAEWDYAFSGKARLLLLRYEAVDLPYWLASVQYIDCTRDEIQAMSQLQEALRHPDTSRYEAAPDYISRPQSKNTQLVYQPLVDEKKADNRARMLESVYQSWILGALRPNLQAGTIDIGLGLKADAVLRHADYEDYRLPDSSHAIAQVFEDMHGELLILGEPGSGKTILMLQLAESLLALAQADEKRAIPVILNLSSWAQKQVPFEDWLITELKRSYTVPEKQAKEWLSQDKLCLLLDGLDEIAPSQNLGDEQGYVGKAAIKLRSEAVEAINRFRETHPKLDMVICSRIRDYETLQKKLNLNGAILLRALNKEQIDSYLLGENYAGVRELLDKEPSALSLAESPFILTTMKSSYEGTPYTGSPHKRLKLDRDSQEKRRDHLFLEYTDKQLKSHPSTNYPPPKTLHYLQWLAYQMLKHEATVFYVEALRLSWIESGKRYYSIANMLALGLVLLLSAGLISGLAYGMAIAIIGCGCIWLLIGPAATSNDIEFAEKISWSVPKDGLFARYWLGMGLISSIFISIFYLPANIDFLPNSIKMSWDYLRASFIFGLGIVVALGLILGIAATLLSGLSINPNIQSRANPNDGLAGSGKNGLIIGLIASLIAGLIGASIFGLIGWRIDKLTTWLIGGLSLGPIVGLIVGLVCGWLAVIQHICIRLSLAHEGHIPYWRYDKFLDYAAEAGFLRKVGGGYIFRHRMLLDYFAEQYQKK
jgi:hypothetical protein